MTTLYKTKTVVKEVEEKEYSHTICDGCGCGLPKRTEYDRNWSVEILNLGHGWFIEDLCQHCVDRLLTFLVVNNFTLREGDW